MVGRLKLEPHPGLRLDGDGGPKQGEILVRDNFPKLVLEILAKRVGYRCSNPSCRQPTVGAHTSKVKAVNVGVAAHIAAALPGGPRFDPSLTPERRSAENGIWLCQICGKLVDNDEARYPASLLLAWRNKSEEAALQVIESPHRRIISENEHSIRFSVDDWNIWRERGYIPGDKVVFIDGWRRGDVRYSCVIWLRNNFDWEEQLYRFRADFRKGDQSLFMDKYILDDRPVSLPPQKWVSLHVCHGSREHSTVEAADSLWLVAETVGDNVRLKWLLARLAVKIEELDEA